jgi:serine/threonine protein kinase
MPSRDERIFAGALARPEQERAAFLDLACNGDAALKERIFALLKAHAGPESLLASAPAHCGARLHEEKPGDAIGLPAVLSAVGLAKVEGSAKAGRYKLLQKIGEGGCGVVWMAEQEEPVRRRVALKVIKLGMDTKAVVARFEAERQALAMMDHPNIAKVHDAGATDTGRPFFVMELVRGIPITRYCDENHLTPAARIQLFIQVCHAVQHAHQKGIIHRDLKPSNILVTVNDGAPTPKIIDFGIAKATQGRLTDATVFTAFEQFIGTPAYMSPEQAEMSSLDIDTRSDIYSLGVLLYELLTGRPPFDPKTFAQIGVDQIRQQIRELEPPRPSARLRTLGVARASRPCRDIRAAHHGRDAHATTRAGRPSHDEPLTTIAHLRSTTPRELISLLRGDLDWIVMRCIEKDRTRRYDTANGLAMDLQRYLRNEPVVARPPSTAYLLQKLVRRHRLAFVAGSLVFATVLAGFGVSMFAFFREKAARQSAAEARSNGERLLTFVFTDLGEQLHDVGQLPLLRQLTDRTIDYYEKLPPSLRTRETQANHAFALAGIGALGWMLASSSAETDFGQPKARARLDRAMQLFDRLEATGPLTPFMRVAGAGVCFIMAEQRAGEGKLDEALDVYARGERLLAPAVVDPEWGGWAQRLRAKIAHCTGYRLTRLDRANEAVLEFQRALGLSAEADRRARHTPRPGFYSLHIHSDMTEALFNARRADEARAMSEAVCRQMRDYIQDEPHLVTARWALGVTAKNLAIQYRSQWRFAEAFAAIDEARAQFRQLLSRDPRNLAFYSWPPVLAVCRARLHLDLGEFGAAEASLREAIELGQVDFIPPVMQPELCSAIYLLAQVYTATRRHEDAQRELFAAAALEKRMPEGAAWRTSTTGMDFTAPQVTFFDREIARRQVDLQRLDWTQVRDGARRVLQRPPDSNLTEPNVPQATYVRNRARADLIRANFELGELIVAARELENWNVSHVEQQPMTEIQSRFDRLGALLIRIHVLARAGKRTDAQTELAKLWPEVEAVFAAGPDYLFNQVQTARALAIRAEVEGTAAEKRGWLERAAGYLRPAAVAGKLTRYEGEVLLAGIENQLATLAGAGRP